MEGNKNRGEIKIKVPLPVFGTAQQERENPPPPTISIPPQRDFKFPPSIAIWVDIFSHFLPQRNFSLFSPMVAYTQNAPKCILTA